MALDELFGEASTSDGSENHRVKSDDAPVAVVEMCIVTGVVASFAAVKPKSAGIAVDSALMIEFVQLGHAVHALAEFAAETVDVVHVETAHAYETAVVVLLLVAAAL